MYQIADYGRMIADGVRMDAYASALRRAVRPDSIVLDIGAGTGVFSLLACRLGARRVYVVEPADAIHVAREAFEAGGCGGRVTFFQEKSTRVTLPEPADVMVSDVRGILPMFQRHIPCIADARQRLLAPGAVMIPQRDIMWAAVVRAPDKYGELVSPWEESRHGPAVAAGKRLVTNMSHKLRASAEQLLAPPLRWAVLDYTTIVEPDVAAELTWTVERSATAHGLLVWFDAELADGIGFSNGPGGPELIYGQCFFPWTEPVALGAGDTVSVVLRADLVGEHYVWRWDTCVRAEGDGGRVKADFRQSGLHGVPLSPAGLRKRADSHVPMLNEQGEIQLFVLGLMQGGETVGDIARRVRDRYPDHFARWQDALTLVGSLSQQFSR